jgi:hypothetical protein
MMAGPEFGHEQGKTFLVAVKALYGIKSVNFSFRSYMGFQSTIADPDVWLWAAAEGDGEKYYEYLLMYVDDILAILADARSILEDVQRTFILKNDRIETPEFISVQSCRKRRSMLLHAGPWKNVEGITVKKKRRMPTSNVKTPMNATYSPEADVTEELKSDDLTLFQELICVLQWATEIGRVNIVLEVSLLSQYQANPREGHLEPFVSHLCILAETC